MLVVDACVSLKWALDDEEAVAEAVALRDWAIRSGCQMLAPSLWAYEIGNGLVTAVRGRRISRSTGAEALASLLRLGVRFVDPEPEDVYAQALLHGLASYDAAYLALARAVGAPLWTGDRPFYQKVGQRADFVRWIGDFAQP